MSLKLNTAYNGINQLIEEQVEKGCINSLLDKLYFPDIEELTQSVYCTFPEHQREEISLENVRKKIQEAIEKLSSAGFKPGCTQQEINNGFSQIVIDSIVDTFDLQDAFSLIKSEAFLERRKTVSEAIKNSAFGDITIFNKGAPKKILAINALGISADPWLNLVCDSQLDAEVILWHTPTALDDELGPGGGYLDSIMRVFATKIQPLLSAETVLIGWCNASRVALAVAQQLPDIIAKVLLIAPSFYESTPIDVQASKYEIDMHRFYDLITANPKAAEFVVTMMQKQMLASSGHVEENSLPATMSRPPEKLIAGLALPWANPEDFQQYSSVNIELEQLSSVDLLNNVCQPLVIVCGEFDHIISLDYVKAILSRVQKSHTLFKVSGAGHYLQFEQYAHIRNILLCLLESQPFPQYRGRIHMVLDGGN